MPAPSLAVSDSTVHVAYSRPTRRGRRIYVLAIDRSLRVLRARVLAARKWGSYDEFNPSLATDSTTGALWACFYVTGTGGKSKYATYSCTYTADGESWAPVRAVADVASNETQPGSYSTPSGIEGQYGAYEGLAVMAGVAHPIWTDSRRFKFAREEIYSTVPRG